jgi:two-component system chemotaxis sensor kinase CheA
MAVETSPVTPPPPPVVSEPSAPAAETSAAPPASGSDWSIPAEVDAGLLVDFIAESRDNISSAEGLLLRLEENPADKEALDGVFRVFHNIKGASGYLGLLFLSGMAHHLEDLLSRIRDGETAYTPASADLALRAIDLVRNLLKLAESASPGSAVVKPAEYDPLIDDLVRACRGELVEKPKDARPPVATEEAKPVADASVVKAGGTGTEASVRIRTDRLDRLINLVGELVVGQAMVAQDPLVVSRDNHRLAEKVGQIGKIVRELQDLSMSLRMVPLRATFQKMTRLGRDLAHKMGKEVEINVSGEDTEIDRNMVDIVDGLLVHMVRNSLDHGLENPEERKRAGKSAKGVITLAAYHSGGNVVFDIRDDGRGLNRQKIRQKALSQNLIGADEPLSDSEVMNLIFRPGFSTAEKVTEVSGRGVGMDVVKKGVDALRGRIDVASDEGRNCAFTLRLPLTLAITDGIVVGVGSQRYILPAVGIRATLQPKAKDIVVGGECLLFMEKLVPILRLHKLFNVAGAQEDPTRALLVLVEEGTQRYALLVDEIAGKQQVVAKSLGAGVKKVQGIFGGAILGDGRVGLILDPPGIAALVKNSHGKTAPVAAAA